MPGGVAASLGLVVPILYPRAGGALSADRKVSMATPTLAESRSPTLAEMAAAATSSSSNPEKRAKVSISVAELKNTLLPLHSCSYSAPAPPLGDISTSLAEWKSFEEELKQWHELRAPDTLLLRHGLEGLKKGASLWGAMKIFLESWYAGILVASQPAIGLMELFVVNWQYFPGVRSVLLGVYGKQGMVRLANYMVANQVSLGLAVDDKGIAFCKRTGGSKLLVCRMKRAPYTALGFMLHLSMENQFEQPPLVDLVYDSLPDSKGMWAQICSGFPAGRLKDPAEVVSRLQFLQWSRLETGVTAIRPERIRCYIVRTKYEGRSVVLKLRDLSKHYEGLLEKGDWRSGVQETIKEVDVYMRLRRCQGSEVPRLLRYGFMEGGMFTFLMLTDERVGDVEMVHYSINQLQHAAIARGGIRAVKALHARGLLYGRQFGTNDLVLSCSAEDGNPPLGDAKLVGFSQVKVCEPTDLSFGLEAAREICRMNDIVELLRPKN